MSPHFSSPRASYTAAAKVAATPLLAPITALAAALAAPWSPHTRTQRVCDCLPLPPPQPRVSQEQQVQAQRAQQPQQQPAGELQSQQGISSANLGGVESLLQVPRGVVGVAAATSPNTPYCSFSPSPTLTGAA